MVYWFMNHSEHYQLKYEWLLFMSKHANFVCAGGSAGKVVLFMEENGCSRITPIRSGELIVLLELQLEHKEAPFGTDC